MTEAFIDTHFDTIKNHSYDIEKRLNDMDYTSDSLKEDNLYYIKGFIQSGEQVTLIEKDYKDYEETIKAILEKKII